METDRLLTAFIGILLLPLVRRSRRGGPGGDGGGVDGDGDGGGGDGD
jgi:hypothetical protein